MSFGKDNSHLSNIQGFGGTGGRGMIQRAKSNARRPTRSGGGGGKPYWKDTYKPPMVGSDIGRLLPGEYVQEVTHDGETIVQEQFAYYMFREHMSKMTGKLRGGICSAGPLFASKKGSRECLGCPIFWEDVQERKAKKARGDKTKGPNRMTTRDQYVFNWFDYGIYFEMPEVDNNGQFRMNPKTNQPYTHWVKASNPNDPQFAGHPWKQGMLLPWVMGETYKDVLLNYADVIGQDCASCGTRSSIRCVMKTCANCHAHIYDPSNCGLTDEQRDQIDNYPYDCKQCGHKGYVDEVIECSACQTPARAQLWDVDLQVQALGSKGQMTYLQILNWSEVRPLQVSDPEVLNNLKPLDFAKRFAPTPLEVQSKIWDLPLNTSTQPQSQQPMVAQQPQMQPPQPPAAPQPQMQPPPPPMQQPQMGQPQFPQPQAQPPMQPPVPPQAPQPAAQPVPMQQPPVVPYDNQGS